MELEIDRRVVNPGTSVSVEWMGVWYDGTIVKIGPKYNLYKVLDPSCEKSALVESNQLKQLESKLAQSHNKRFAFNDGDNWIEVIVIDADATGDAKVSWRKNVHSPEIESWFEKKNITLSTKNETYKPPKELLEASKSGLLPVKSIEGHSRTVQNVMYQSDAESDESSTHNSNGITIQSKPSSRPNQSTPVHEHQHSIADYPEDDSYATHSWSQPPMIPPPVISRLTILPPKNITQSSMPCVWSYSSQQTNGIAPHHTSLFFFKMRQMRQTKTSQNHSHLDHQINKSKAKYQSRSRTHSLKKINTSTAEEEFGRRHSVFNQFVLNKDPRMEDWTKRKPPRRSVHRLQGHPPKIVSTSPGVISVNEGDNILLTCNTNGTQPIEYKWLKDGKDTLHQTPRVKYSGPGILRITKATAHDAGTYSCTASNALGSVSHEFIVTVTAAEQKNHQQTLLTDIDEILPEINLNGDAEVQEYLDALVDEIHISDGESERTLQKKNIPSLTISPPPPPPVSISNIPRLRVSSSFDTEMEQYLFGYGDDYGQLSSANTLERPLEESKAENACDSIEVHTSLGSSRSSLPMDDTNTPGLQLPTEEESILDQVNRFHSSMEDEPTTKVKQKKWFNRIFKKK